MPEHMKSGTEIYHHVLYRLNRRRVIRKLGPAHLRSLIRHFDKLADSSDPHIEDRAVRDDILAHALCEAAARYVNLGKGKKS